MLKILYVSMASKINVLLLICFFILHNYSTGQNFQYPQRYEKINQSYLTEFWQQIDDIFNDPNFSNADWGVVIKSLETGEYFYKRDENKLKVPASTLKLFTTAAGLVLLGPEYKFKTELYMNGRIDGTTLVGDLVVRGFGDPTISARFNDGDTYKVFNQWADTLLSLGIDEISGNIIGDDNTFEDNGLGAGWTWDEETQWFSASTGAICFNDNCVDISVKPSEPGTPAVISILPDTKYVTIINKVETVDSANGTELNVYRDRGTNLITVYGKIEAGSDGKKLFSTINNPTQFSMVVLKKVFQKKGILIKGYASDIDEETLVLDYSIMERLLTYHSIPLFEIIKVINKDSHNFYAEQLLKVIGYEKARFGSVENGVRQLKYFLRDIGINPETMIIADGSGLSRLNLITPKQVVDLLSAFYKMELFPYFYQSFPIAGIDGSLALRMRKSKAENNVRGKTGYLNGVRSLSGYLFTSDDEPVAYSIIVNNFIVPASIADNLLDLVCLRLTNFSRK